MSYRNDYVSFIAFLRRQTYFTCKNKLTCFDWHVYVAADDVFYLDQKAKTSKYKKMYLIIIYNDNKIERFTRRSPVRVEGGPRLMPRRKSKQ